MKQFAAQGVGYSRVLDLLRRIHGLPMSSFCYKEYLKEVAISG